MKILTIRFRQSGGFAGLVRGCEAAPEDLRADDRRALERRAHDTSAVATPAGASRARDLAVYEIALETASGDKRLEFDEMSVPEDLAALVEWLAKRSRPMPP